MSKLTAINFVEEFSQELNAGGDMFFSSGDDKSDMELIISTIKQQGYWAGVSLRYYFDMELLSKRFVKLLATKERTFG